MKWYRLCFRVIGNFHVGSRKWGYVRSGRPYLPGWTFWGALTAFLVQSGRKKDYHDTGYRLHTEFWFSHFFFRAKTAGESSSFYYLPCFDQNRGLTSYCWQNLEGRSPATDIPIRPALRPGIVRTGGRETSPLGNLFLTETINAGLGSELWLEGRVAADANMDIPLWPGDALLIGGNRSSNGCELIFENCRQDNEPRPDLCHLSMSAAGPCDTGLVRGELERVVLRRTRNRQGADCGFGGHFEDWDVCLAPGWAGEDTGKIAVRPCRDRDQWYYHGIFSQEAG